MFIFAVISISFMNGVETWGALDLAREEGGDEMDSSGLECVSAIFSESTSSPPDWTGLTGGSDGRE